jgi:hypothetical protein
LCALVSVYKWLHRCIIELHVPGNRKTLTCPWTVQWKRIVCVVLALLVSALNINSAVDCNSHRPNLERHQTCLSVCSIYLLQTAQLMNTVRDCSVLHAEKWTVTTRWKVPLFFNMGYYERDTKSILLNTATRYLKPLNLKDMFIVWTCHFGHSTVF